MTNSEQTRQIRSDWRRHRRALNIDDPPSGDDFALGGIAAQALPLDARIVILPTEPLDADRVELNSATTKWLGENTRTESSAPAFRWGHSTTPSSSALVHGSWSNDERQWDRYLAIHRHGGLEAGLARAAWGAGDNQRLFSLRRIVAAMWAIADLQVEAADKWSIEGPWEISLALRDTAGAGLSDYAEGWPPTEISDTTTPCAANLTCSTDGSSMTSSRKLWPSAPATESRTRSEQPNSGTSRSEANTKANSIHVGLSSTNGHQGPKSVERIRPGH